MPERPGTSAARGRAFKAAGASGCQSFTESALFIPSVVDQHEESESLLS